MSKDILYRDRVYRFADPAFKAYVIACRTARRTLEPVEHGARLLSSPLRVLDWSQWGLGVCMRIGVDQYEPRLTGAEMGALRGLVDLGVWRMGDQWYWKTPTVTLRAMRALADKGLAFATSDVAGETSRYGMRFRPTGFGNDIIRRRELLEQENQQAAGSDSGDTLGRASGTEGAEGVPALRSDDS